ncbi:MAG: glucose 1-dehydrogenase [Polyangiaceae bacterium]|nr:glucose 1-dehydrogenase [Polyangiaceae bacterium]
MDLGLAGKVALVTGGSRGIGKAIALGLAAEGASVFIVARGEEQLDETTREIEKAGGVVRAAALDIATEAGAKAAVADAVSELGGLDILVNNAGGSLGAGKFGDADGEAWRRVVDLNLMSAVWCSQAALRAFEARGGGVIVNVSSICGLEYCSSAPYQAAKGAIAALTKEMGIDLAKKKVRVVAVAPGSIMFPGGSWDKRRQTMPERIEKMIQEDLPWGRFGTPEEIADVVVFACSSRASWVTGSSIVVDGGQMRGM